MTREHGSFERSGRVLAGIRGAGRVAGAALALALGGCPQVVVDAGTGGGTTTGTTTAPPTTTSTTTTGSTTTTQPCACAQDTDCPTGTLCQECQCLPTCEVIDCICLQGTVVPCYSGPPGTEGIGLCKAGTQTCDQVKGWGPCEGQVLPAPEICGNGWDDDCDGVMDGKDEDGDGWTPCKGDCCDTPACSDHPEQVNPGAQEIPGDGIDNDCNPATPDGAPFPDCTGPALAAPTGALELVKAMDLCQLTTESPPLEQKTWGVISTHLSLANDDGVGQPMDLQGGVLSKYGPNVLPQAGATMAALSSGTARAEADPGFVYPQNGYLPGQMGNFIAGTQSPIPAVFLDAHGGKVPTSCGTCDVPECAGAFDSVSLEMRVRVPTNAFGFSVMAKFYTAEFPENLCTQYNDFFVALLTSQIANLPADHNVAHDEKGNPFSVNDVFLDECAYADKCPQGSLELVGTGMGGWDGVLVEGAATTWQQISAPLVPGETIELRFEIWDAIDGNVDSLILLDRFRWLPKAAPL